MNKCLILVKPVMYAEQKAKIIIYHFIQRSNLWVVIMETYIEKDMV